MHMLEMLHSIEGFQVERFNTLATQIVSEKNIAVWKQARPLMLKLYIIFYHNTVEAA